MAVSSSTVGLGEEGKGELLGGGRKEGREHQLGYSSVTLSLLIYTSARVPVFYNRVACQMRLAT